MSELSSAAEAILNSITLKRYDVPYYACPASIDQMKSDAATVLWAAAQRVVLPKYQYADWKMADIIMKELQAIADELDGAQSTNEND